MACYISAGHHLKDPGAVANGLKEADLTVRVRDEVVRIVKDKGYKVFTDSDKETLAEYLGRIKPGEASVVVEFHFDAASNPKASGTSAFYADNADQNDISFAKEMANVGAIVMGIPNRGHQSEAQSHRGKLGLLRKQGIVCLVEVAFITNPADLVSFEANFKLLCQKYAETIMRYDDLVP